MSLNWKEIDLVLAELHLPGSFVQRITQPDFSSLVLSIYRPGEPFELFVSLVGGKTRLHRLSGRPKSPAKLQRFAQLLRSRCSGARIREAYQIRHDRIVKVVLSAAGAVTILWIRLWGGAANIIATDEGGTIVDAFYRRPGRGEVSGGHYDPESELAAEGRAQEREYEVRDLPGEGDFNTRVEAYYREQAPKSEIETLRGEVLTAIERRESRVVTSIENLERRRKEFEGAERLRQLGDLVMGNLGSIPEGERWVRLSSFEDAEESVDVELDPTLRPEQNAEAYYAKYKKAKSGRQKLAAELEELRSSLEELRNRRKRAEAAADVQILRRLLGAAREMSAKSDRETGPGIRFQSGGHRILVGRSAKENDELLRRHVRGNDLWLHARDYPGAYVFIKTLPGKSVPLDVLLDAGNLALHYSKARSGGQAELYYTQVKYLRRPKEGKKGLVLPTQEKNLLVRHDPARIERLLREREESQLGK